MVGDHMRIPTVVCFLFLQSSNSIYLFKVLHLHALNERTSLKFDRQVNAADHAMHGVSHLQQCNQNKPAKDQHQAVHFPRYLSILLLHPPEMSQHLAYIYHRLSRIQRSLIIFVYHAQGFSNYIASVFVDNHSLTLKSLTTSSLVSIPTLPQTYELASNQAYVYCRKVQRQIRLHARPKKPRSLCTY
ncbi:hypothetical protein BJY04DRAFT_121270 [Aspergillus karnatakaensis]